MARWKHLAYCMNYSIVEVNAFKENFHGDSQKCCQELLKDWLSTNHGPTPKTYQTLLNHIKKIDDLAAVSEEIEEKLIKGKEFVIIVATKQ